MTDFVLWRAVRKLSARIDGTSGSTASGVTIEQLASRVESLIGTTTTHAQITADQDDYDLGDRGRHRLGSDAAWSITGFVATTSEQPEDLWNVGSFAITIKHQSGSSAAANRVICSGSADLVMYPTMGVVAFYDAVDTRWRAFLR